MARNFRDGLPWSPCLELWDPIIPDFKEKPRPRLPTWIPPQQPPPDFKVWDRLIRGMPETEPRPFWLQPQLPPSPPQPGPSPFPDPVPSPSLRQTPPAHEVDPPNRGSLVTEIRSEPAGGLLGLLQEAMRQSELQPDAGFDPSPQDALAQAAAIQSKQPIRRLVRMRVGDDTRPLNLASLPLVDLQMTCSTANRCDAG